jgi:WD40 repeat protein
LAALLALRLAVGWLGIIPVADWVDVRFLTDDGSSILTQAAGYSNGPPFQTWDTHSGENLSSYLERSDFSAIQKVVLSPGGRFLAVLEREGNLCLIDLKMSKARKTNFNLHFSDPSLTFSRRDSYLTVSGFPVSYLVECNTDREGILFPEGRDDQYFFGFADDETVLYMDVGVFTHWDQRAGKIRHTFADVVPLELCPDGHTVLAHRLDADGMDNVLFFLDVHSKKSWPLSPSVTFEQVRKSGFSPDGKTLIAFGDGEFIFWDVATGKQRRRAERTNLATEDPGSFSPDSATFHLDSSPEHLTLWDSASGRFLWKWDWGDDCPLFNRFGHPTVTKTRFSADSQFLFVPTFTGLEILEARTGKKRHSIQGSHVSFGKNDRFFAYTHMANTPEPGFMKRLLGNWWPAKDRENEYVVRVIETASGKMVAQLPQAFGHLERNAIYKCKGYVSNDGGTLITPYRSENGSVSLRVWDLPLRPPLLLVIGIPLGLGLLVLLFSRWRAWRQKRVAGATVEPVSLNPEQKL